MIDHEFTFRDAKFEEFPHLIKMWQDCFHDSPKATGNIFMNLQKPENILVLADKTEPVAMLSVLDFTLTAPKDSCKAAYLYGVATSPSKQGKGLGSMLLSEAGTLLAHRGYACSVLVPASDSLFDYYGKRGYKNAFNINKAKVSANDIGAGKTVPLEKIDSARLGLIRDARLSDSRMFACWDARYLEYVVQESEFYGGGTYEMIIDKKQICAVCHRDGGTVYVKELAATPRTLEDAISSLHAYFGADTYELYLREDFAVSFTIQGTNNLLPFAMIQWYDDNAESKMTALGGAAPYIAHVLD